MSDRATEVYYKVIRIAAVHVLYKMTFAVPCLKANYCTELFVVQSRIMFCFVFLIFLYHVFIGDLKERALLSAGEGIR